MSRTPASAAKAAPHADVEEFLASLGCEAYAQSLIYNGFYTSLDALRLADYHDLLECNVRPVHARLIVSNLRGVSRGTPSESGSSGEAEVTSFLRSIGLENCASPVLESGFTSLDALRQCSMSSLLDAGLKPVHARLIVSNLDSAAAAGLSVSGTRGQHEEDEALAPLVPLSLAPAVEGADGVEGAGAGRRRNPLKCVLLITGVLMLVLVPLLVHQAHKGAPLPPAAADAAAVGRLSDALSPHRRPKGGRKKRNSPPVQ